MPDLLGKIRRGMRKPPSYIAARLLHEAKASTERVAAPARARALNARKLCRLTQARDINELWARCAARPFPFFPKTAESQSLEVLCPGELERIRREAGDAKALRVDLLGSGPVTLTRPIDWACDFKAGRRWPNAFFRSIEYSNLGEPSDVKVPWELSRLQWLIPLAQQYVLGGDNADALTTRNILEDWIEANPFAWSVNWTCTMEAAIRIFTLSWLFHALHASPAFADEEFRFKFLKLVYLHGDFTERHIERSDINGNHFTADAAALVFAGLFFGMGEGPVRWRDAGMMELAREVLLQVLPDGVDFEGSIPYHRLNLELFGLPAFYAQAHGLAVPAHWVQRLQDMARFTAAYMRRDGRSPVWGDADNARALPMAQVQGQFTDHRYLLGLVGWYTGDDELMRRFSGPVSELYWLCGPDAARKLKANPPPPYCSKSFQDAGLFVLADGEDHVFVSCGPVGMGGRGGHAHNDQLSFEAVLAGQTLIVDSGCNAYTGSVEDRNLFRSTGYHNTPQVDAQEINRMARLELWSRRNDAQPHLREFSTSTGAAILTLSHTGYQRLPEPVTPVRRFILKGGALRITDTYEGMGRHSVTMPLHLDPGVAVEVAGPGEYRLATPGGVFSLSWSGEGWHSTIAASRYAPSYGTVVPSRRIVWELRGKLKPLNLHIRRLDK